METKDSDNPISIIKIIRTLLVEFNDKNKRTIRGNEGVIWKNPIHDRIDKLLERNLTLLDISLSNLKIEDEEKYFKFKDIICILDNDIEELYKIKEVDSPFPISPPNTIKNHVRDLQVFQFVNKSGNNQTMDLKEDSIEEVELTENELKRIKDKIAMMIELGIIDHLITKYPYVNGYAIRLTKLLSPFLGIEVDSLKKIINAYITDQKSKSDYPKITDSVKNIIDKLTLEK